MKNLLLFFGSGFFAFCSFAQEAANPQQANKKFGIYANYSNIYWDRIALSDNDQLQTFTGSYLRSNYLGLTFKKFEKNNWEQQFHLNLGVFPTFMSFSFRQSDFTPFFDNTPTRRATGTTGEWDDNLFYAFGYAIGKAFPLKHRFKLIPSLGISMNRYIIRTNAEVTPLMGNPVLLSSTKAEFYQTDPYQPMGFNFQIPFRLDMHWEFKSLSLGLGFMYQRGIGEFVDTKRAVVFLPNTNKEVSLNSSRKNNFYGLRLILGVNW